jgi:hypothetical protein
MRLTVLRGAHPRHTPPLDMRCECRSNQRASSSRQHGCAGAGAVAVAVGAVRVRPWPYGRGSNEQRKGGGGAGRTEPKAVALVKAGRRTWLLAWSIYGRHWHRGQQGGLAVANYPYSLPRLAWQCSSVVSRQSALSLDHRGSWGCGGHAAVADGIVTLHLTAQLAVRQEAISNRPMAAMTLGRLVV